MYNCWLKSSKVQVDEDVEFRFTGTVKLKAIAVHPDDGDSGPRQLRLYHHQSSKENLKIL
jgi:hypothetical protein